MMDRTYRLASTRCTAARCWGQYRNIHCIVIVSVMLQMHRRVPASLVLGVSTSPSALEALLPLPAVAALRSHHFHLTPAMARVESLYAEARVPVVQRPDTGHLLMLWPWQPCASNMFIWMQLTIRT